jgi:hypothetical protein
MLTQSTLVVTFEFSKYDLAHTLKLLSSSPLPSVLGACDGVVVKPLRY